MNEERLLDAGRPSLPQFLKTVTLAVRTPEPPWIPPLNIWTFPSCDMNYFWQVPYLIIVDNIAKVSHLAPSDRVLVVGHM
jgi:hypothetical protein